MRQSRIEKPSGDKSRQECEHTRRAEQDEAYEEDRQARYDGASGNRDNLRDETDDMLLEIDEALADFVGATLCAKQCVLTE